MTRTHARRNALRLLLLSVLSIWQTRALSSDGKTCQSKRRFKAAIVGAGIGGTSTAYFLRQELGDNVQIDIFEREKVGGRTTAIDVEGRVVEMGASIIHNQNRHFRELAEAVGLQLVEPGKGDTERLFSIFDGKSIVFRQSSWQMITLSRMLWRYGLSYFWFQKSPADMLAKFVHIYQLQNQGHGFRSPEELLQKVELYQLTQQTMRHAVQEILGAKPSAARFGRELVAAINHVNYNQNNSLNAMAGMVSMLPTVDSNVLAIKGGNYRLAEEVLSVSNVTLHLPAKVSLVEKTGSSYFLHQQDESHGPYDVVVLASPLEHSGITLNVSHLPILPPRKYQTTVTTILRGNLNRTHFGSSPSPAGDYILVAEGSNSPFSVISPLEDYADGTRLYKVFSAEPLTDNVLGLLFPGARVVASHIWKAYPKFHPPERFARLELSEGLYYNNAIETAASAMEMSLIAAKNSAILASQYLAKKEDVTVLQELR